jgi:iron complex outermembrane receptor protein
MHLSARTLLAALTLLSGGTQGQETVLENVVVTATRRAQPAATLAGSIGVVDDTTLRQVGHRHPSEVLFAVPGTWISRGSGQEHLTAIRSPVLTGAGACGAFLMLEDGIPVRPVGFCNVNQLFEVNTEQAERIEVWRGAGSGLHGSNAVHGIINVLPRVTGSGLDVSAEVWNEQYVRGMVGWSEQRDEHFKGLALVSASEAGGRDAAGFDSTKLNAHWGRPLAQGSLRVSLSGAYLNQDTAGFITGLNAYQDEVLAQSNPNPEAYRDATALRLVAVWQRDLGPWAMDLRSYLRHSDMEFLQHFLPGQPVEENGQTSFGASLTLADETRAGFRTGMDFEASTGYLREYQPRPLTTGSAFLQETRPAGAHYDYDVTAILLAPHVSYSWQLGERTELSAALRAEYLRYQYDNQMLDGNTRDDGTPCGFGGCLFSRPADRSDAFFNLAPKLGWVHELSANTRLFASLARGFRVPQATELYRLQRQQNVADLDTETLDAVELGVRHSATRWSLDAAAFAGRKRNFIFRDAAGFNVSDGRTRHLGVELDLAVRLAPRWDLQLATTYARHTYRFDRLAGRGEIITAGNEVDTAPNTLGQLALHFRPLDSVDLQLRWLHQGSYFLDAANLHYYEGHDIADFRASIALSGGWTLQLAVDNVFDTRFADRADFAFGTYRYFPDPGRRFGFTIRYRRP